MNVIEINASWGCAPTIDLGQRGENLATEVRFNFAGWAEEFGAPGAVELYARRAGETTPYPVALTIEDTVAVWPVSAIDTHIIGLGEAELVYLINGTVVKTAVYGTSVEPDIGKPDGTPPDPYESWMEALGEMAAGTLINAQRAETAQDGAEAAQTAAEAAQSAAETAQESAEAAQTGAEAAQTAAEAAQSAAESAQTGAQDAESRTERYRADAEGFAVQSMDNARAAAASATTAQTAATTATQKATAAANSASSAATSASTATQKANAAAYSASIAQDFAGEAIDSAQTAETARDNAQNYATSASASAAAAANSASAAAASASAAAASETAAGNSATAASASETAAEAAQAAAEAVLESIPPDYSTLSDDVDGLKSAFDHNVNYYTTTASSFYWKPGIRVNSSYAYAASAKYAALYDISGSVWLRVLKGSAFTVNSGYTADYAIRTGTEPKNASTTKVEGTRSIAAGTTITIAHDGWLLLSVSDGTNDVETDAAALATATAGLTLNLITADIREVTDGQTADIAALDAFAAKANTGSDIVASHLIWPQNIAIMAGRINGNLKDDETIEESTSYKTSVYFPIKPSTTYIVKRSSSVVTRVHLYDYAKRPIEIPNVGSATGGVFTTPANAVYARLCSNTGANWQINEGTELLEYTAATLPALVADTVDDVSPYFHGPYDIYASDFSGWYSGQQSDYTTEGFGRDTTYDEVIDAFDALAALDTQYITKTELGDASGTGYKLYEYAFVPKSYSSTKNARKLPKIYMDGSIHGFEKCSTYGLYFFLKDLVTNWDKVPALEAIRHGVEIHVIPVSNPHGFDNNTYKNANSVNINRNFDHPGDWVIIDSGSDQNGLEAFDQPESAIIRDWLLAAEADVMFYANLHTNGQYFTTGTGEMNCCMTSSDRKDEYLNRIFRVFTGHIEAQTVRWPSEHPTITLSSAQFCGKIQAAGTEESTKGTASAWANTMQKMVSMTLEGFNGLKIGDDTAVGLFSADAMRINSENIGNMVIQMCREFAD